MHLQHRWTCFTLLFTNLGQGGNSIDVSHDYFTDVTLRCDDQITSSNRSNQIDVLEAVNQIWLLPNGGIVSNTQEINEKRRIYAVVHINISILHIKRIDNEDFGVYWCVQALSDSSLRAFRHTINIDGPPMEEFYARQRQNAIVGGISAAIVLGVIVFVYIVWHFRCSEKVKREKRLVEDLTKGVDRYNTQIYDNVGMESYVKRGDK